MENNMKKQWYKKSIEENAWLSTLIFFGIAIRLFMSWWHFTHCDDVGIIRTFFSWNEGLNEIKRGYNFASSWTYAPLQGIFMSLLVNRTFPYRLNIFMSRLPSCLFGIACLFLAVKIACFFFKEDQGKKPYFPVFVIALVSLSWENIIYSAQAEPYIIIVFFGLLLILSAFQKFYEDWRMSIKYLAVFTLGCYGHYQFFILIFCYYVALGICNVRNRKKLIRICTLSLANLLLVLPLILFFIQKERFNRGIAWNRGHDFQFYLRLPDTHFAGKLLQALKFFVRNTFYLYKFFFTTDSFDIAGNIFAFLLLFTAAVGFFFMHKKNKVLAVFSDLLTVITGILVEKQKLTFGPSRHCLFLYPMLWLFICYGLSWFMEQGKNTDTRKKALDCSVRTAFAFLVVSFAFSLPREIGNRKNFISERAIQELAEQYSFRYIYVPGWVYDFQAMPLKSFDEVRIVSPGTNLFMNSNTVLNDRRCLIISHTVSFKDFFDSEGIYLQNMRNDFESCSADFSDISIEKTNLLYKKEINVYKAGKIASPQTRGTEVEYAQKYDNFGNGLCLYVIELQN